MSIGGFLKTIVLMLVFSCITCQAVAFDSKDEEMRDAARSEDDSATNGRVNLSIPAPPLFNRFSRPLSLIDKAYLDAYFVLRENNDCSRFFGGPRVATGILNSLYPRLDTSVMENNIGINMFGRITFITDAQTGISYRLFQKALVNLRGPFYRSANYQSQGFFKRIGYYPANTREARVTMLLHELGHLLPGSNGRWLLPDDGGDHIQVAANTAIIMDKCSEQIKSLPPAIDVE